MPESSIETELAELIRQLTEIQQLQLLRIARSMNVRIDVQVNYTAGLVTPEFEREFTARLQAHHGTHSKQLDRISFEDAFRASSEAAGREVHEGLSATNRFYDEVIDGERCALKTTAAKGVRRDFVHISKLSEAAWIQDVRGAKDRMERTKVQVATYTSSVDRLFQLRVLPDRQFWIYDLVEIPLSLFASIQALDKSRFDSDGPTILVEDEEGPCLTFKLDRSDAKITITKIPIERCIVHARWELPKTPPS